MKTSAVPTTRIFLDVDGVLNSYPVPQPRYFLERRRTIRAWDFVLHVRPAIVWGLLRLAKRREVEIVWLSTWSYHCTDDLEPALGMEESLPVIPMPDDSHNRLAGDPDRWWKALAVREWLEEDASRRAIWIDDDLAAPRTHERFAADFPEQLTMIAPVFSKGLTRRDLRRISRLTRRRSPRLLTRRLARDRPVPEQATPAPASPDANEEAPEASAGR